MGHSASEIDPLGHCPVSGPDLYDTKYKGLLDAIERLNEQKGRLRAENDRLREWVDTVGRTCPSNASVDAALSSPRNLAPTEEDQ